MSAVEIPPVPASILKRKSDVSRAIDISKHVMEPVLTPDGTTALSITKRTKIPSNQTLSVVSKQKMVSTEIFHPAREEKVTDIAAIEHQDISNVSRNTRPSQKRRKQQEYPYDGPIYDARYEEMDDEPRKAELRIRQEDMDNVLEDAALGKGSGTIYPKDSPKFRKTPSWDARELGIPKKSKSPEPSTISAISERKQKTKSELTNFNPAKPSTKTRQTPKDPVDVMFDAIVTGGKTAGKVGKTIAKEGFKSTKTGIRAIGELAQEFEKTPIARNWKRNAAAEYAHMKSAGRRARGSIAGTGNTENKRIMTAGNLLTQRGVVARSVTNDDSSNSYGITAKYEKWVDGKTELHYFRNNDRLTHKDVAHMLSKKQVLQLKKEAKNGILVRRKSGIVVNKPKSATASKLTRKTHAGVV